MYTPASLPCCALTDQVSLAAHSGPHPNLMCRLVSRFFLQQCVGFTPEPHPSSTQLRDDAFYGFSPLSCKARGQGLLWISHALRERPNSLLWRASRSLHSSTLSTRLHHYIADHYTTPYEHELIVPHITTKQWWVERRKSEANNLSPPSALTQGLTRLTGGLQVCLLSSLLFMIRFRAQSFLSSLHGSLK